MERLSLSQIADYNNRDAFARVRNGTSSSAASFLESVRNEQDFTRLRSDGIEGSYSILSGVADRLELVRSNLTTMLGYARAGQSATSPTKRDEYIGLMRSLSGGIDDIVDNTVWKGNKLLDGRPIDLSLTANGNGASERLNLQSFYTSDVDGFDLTSQPASSKGTIYYDYYSVFRNSAAGVVGLDIAGAEGSEVAPARQELENGNYRLEISYAGPDSSITIKNSTGVLINTVKGVDLSGSGEEIVDLEVGISLRIEKEQILKSVDKYDYETNGPAKLYAMLAYERTFQHELKQEGFSQFSDQSVNVNYQRDLTDSEGGNLSFGAIKLAGVDSDQISMASGLYNVTVNYNGASSSLEVRGTDGKLAYVNYRVDLSGSEPINIDTGKGLAFTIHNEGYTGRGKMSATLEYEASGNNNDEFDFSAYTRKIESAIARLDADLVQVEQSMQRIYTVYQYQTGNFGNLSNATPGNQATSLITGSAGSDTLFGATSGLFSATAEDLFSSTASAIAAQGEIVYSRYLA